MIWNVFGIVYHRLRIKSRCYHFLNNQWNKRLICSLCFLSKPHRYVNFHNQSRHRMKWSAV